MNRYGTALEEEKVSKRILKAVSHECFEIKPTATCKLTIRFVKNGKPTMPKGTLMVDTERGKLSKQIIELQGKKSIVNLSYTAPDETIKNTIRAKMEGFSRGKIHLHIIGD
jgi:hypothetical protein